MGQSSYQIHRGSPSPLGASKQPGGVNFALFSEHAAHVNLCLFTPRDPHPFLDISLDAHKHHTGNIWHVCISSLPDEVEYAFRIQGPEPAGAKDLFNPQLLMCDPYAKSLNTSHTWGQQDLISHPLRGRLIHPSSFDWEGDRCLHLPFEELIIYEMHVRGFTIDTSSHAKHPGTYLGVIEKIPHLKKLGINAIELLPVFEFSECENKKKNPLTRERLFNFWGYSTLNYFSPMNRYATSDEWGAATDEFKTMVKALHKEGIEVILDVVFNHTSEGGKNGPITSFKGIDNADYYLLSETGEYLDFTGCGNTFNSNHPQITAFIVDALRYWVKEMHVDGFRFDLASTFTRDEKGGVITGTSPVIEAINKDPLLSKTKLIAEAWDAAGLYQVGSFPGEGKWAEWNGYYRDSVRKFIKGTDGTVGDFVRAICGSENLYGKDKLPYNSINFVVAHDGFSLQDLVSYNDKHNESNGEENRDGNNSNDSWNCGCEGETNNRDILALREKQKRNFHVALMFSLGTPMILMCDEYCHTCNGNNNTWCHDNKLNWFLWDTLSTRADFFRFYCALIQLRRRLPLLQRTTFLTDADVVWHGHTPLRADWSETSRFIAYTLKDLKKENDIYVAFNAHFEAAHVELPPPPLHKKWYRVIDTSLQPPSDFIDHPEKSPPLKFTYDMPSHSTLVAFAL